MKIVFFNSCCVVFLFVSLFGYSQNTLTLKKGIVVDSLLVPNTNNDFSIYLPKSFEMNRNWPVLFGFNSQRRASNLTRLYREAAEEFGYIVAISNFSEGQDLKEKVMYVSTFMDYIFSVFPIQKDRVYVTGIDQDAKLMSLLPALNNEEVFGVIAIGDSHYYNSKIKIAKNFSYFGVLSINNFRYRDFIKNKEYLKRKAIEADVLTYEGTSDYPYPKLLKKPLSTFSLQAMAKGRIPKDSTWVRNLFQHESNEAVKELNQGRFVNAYEELKRVRAKFRLFLDTSSLLEKEKQIKKSRGYKKQKRLKSKYANQESFFRYTYLLSLKEDVAEEKYENLGWWQYQMSELDTLAFKNEKYAQNMVLRVKGFLKNAISEYKQTLSEKRKNFEKKMFLSILSTIVDKKDFESYREIISLSAQDQDYQTALFYLEKLLVNEFTDMDALYNIEGTLALRMSKEYNDLIKKYLGTSKYFFSN